MDQKKKQSPKNCAGWQICYNFETVKYQFLCSLYLSISCIYLILYSMYARSLNILLGVKGLKARVVHNFVLAQLGMWIRKINFKPKYLWAGTFQVLRFWTGKHFKCFVSGGSFIGCSNFSCCRSSGLQCRVISESGFVQKLQNKV